MSRKKSYKGRTKMRYPSNKVLAEQIAKLKRSQLGTEFKYHDTEDVIVSAIAGEVIPLSLIPQDDTSQGRDALLVRLQSIHMKLMLHTDKDNNVPSVRIILIFDNMCIGELPVIAGELLEGVDILDFKEKHQSKGRFTFLYDKVFVMNRKGSGGTLDDYPITIFPKPYYKRYKKFAPVINYTGTVGNIANCGKRNLFLVIIGNDDVNPTNVQYNVRLRFTG